MLWEYYPKWFAGEVSYSLPGAETRKSPTFSEFQVSALTFRPSLTNISSLPDSSPLKRGLFHPHNLSGLQNHLLKQLQSNMGNFPSLTQSLAQQKLFQFVQCAKWQVIHGLACSGFLLNKLLKCKCCCSRMLILRVFPWFFLTWCHEHNAAFLTAKGKLEWPARLHKSIYLPYNARPE